MQVHVPTSATVLPPPAPAPWLGALATSSPPGRVLPEGLLSAPMLAAASCLSAASAMAWFEEVS